MTKCNEIITRKLLRTLLFFSIRREKNWVTGEWVDAQ